MQRKTKHIAVTTTTSTKAEADAIAQALLENRVAACVQVEGPIESSYRWEGAIQSDQEWRLTIKTCADRYQALESIVIRLHSYDEPQVIAIPIVEGSPGYLHWISQETQEHV